MENAPPPDVHCLAEGAVQLHPCKRLLIVSQAGLVDEEGSILTRLSKPARRSGIGGESRAHARWESAYRTRTTHGGEHTLCSSHQNALRPRRNIWCRDQRQQS